MKSIRRTNRKGFATFTAVSMALFVGIVAAMLTRGFASDIRRTGDERAQAQLRQYTLAAAYLAADRINTSINDNATASWTVTLPALDDKAIQANVEVKPADQNLVAEITFHTGTKPLHSQAKFVRTNGRWLPNNP